MLIKLIIGEMSVWKLSKEFLQLADPFNGHFATILFLSARTSLSYYQ